MIKHWKLSLAVILGINLFLLFFLKFTAWPEMLLWPYLITKGWLPYTNIAIAHTPLLLIKLAIFFKIFGVGIMQLKIFTWIFILLLDVLVFYVSKKLWNVKTALIALVSFAVFQIFFDGNGLWFDLFMGLTAFVSFYFVRKKNWLFAGVFMALAIISKQTAIWFLLPTGIELLSDRKDIFQKTKKYILGTLLVAVPFVLILWAGKILPSFFNWAINFGVFVLPKAQGQIQLPDLKNLAVAGFPFLVFIPLILKDRKNIFLLFWAISGSMGAYPRFEYFHFQPALPYLTIASGLILSDHKKYKNYLKVFLIIWVIGFFYLFANYFVRNWKEGTRFYETSVIEVSSYIKDNTKAGDKVFVMNWWDNIYPLSNTLPATDPWVPQLSWYTETPGIQEDMVKDLSESQPKFIILYPYSGVGLSAYVPKKVYDYVSANYKLDKKIGGIEILIPQNNYYANSHLK